MRIKWSSLMVSCAVAAVLPMLSVRAEDSAGMARKAPQRADFWWPDHLDLSPLRQHDERSDPLGANFDYAKAFARLDLKAVKADIRKVLTNSQDWWPADYGNYGPFFIRMAWHGAGTYRIFDGRGGADGADQRFEPLNSWPDNVSLDKARRLLWPIKQKYGQSISWGDLMVLTGNVAMESMGFQTALIAGGHTFGKAHGAHDAGKCLGPEPAAAGVEEQGLGWKNACGKGNGDDTITSGLEGSWSADPVHFTTQYFDNLLRFNWVKTKSPAGATQWIPDDPNAALLAPDAQDPAIRHAPIMFTTDLALKFDPAYSQIAKRFHEHPEEFKLAFAKAWFKLTHRDMGPKSRYIGTEVPKEDLIWQDPLPKAPAALIGAADISALKAKILESGLTVPQLVRTTWAAAVTFRGTDYRGGANGARIRLAPQKDWAVNNPPELAKVLQRLDQIQQDFNAAHKGQKQVSLADLIVLGGDAAVEQAAKAAGHPVEVAFTPGRVDAEQAQTDVNSFAVLEPTADAFRNYYAAGQTRSPAELMVDRANLLTLSVPEMTALIGGLRVLNANEGQSANGVLTHRPGKLSNDFFVNLLDMSTVWKKSDASPALYEGHDRKTGELRWTATPVDLAYGSNSELRAVAEVYAESDGEVRFLKQFVEAWTKVTNLDRFDLHR